MHRNNFAYWSIKQLILVDNKVAISSYFLNFTEKKGGMA
ncbi:Uncharacterised protein [Mycoplasmoides pneumoniae]|uniref:Uncharacterized protein n=2 Tax=Mycoplasmoides pneumoniae TaxID=2104 RepID=A0AB38W874_MYCPM|nr:hypothetical protein MPNE_0041 [Mycoplasmoides pneumoniae FH]VEU57475.1 Uncharacterised protein [Mycoplasmoides pneumoniae]